MQHGELHFEDLCFFPLVSALSVRLRGCHLHGTSSLGLELARYVVILYQLFILRAGSVAPFQ